MKRSQRLQIRATGLVRTLVVASASLAILLVCFAIYEFSQPDVDVGAAQRKPRLPPIRSTADKSENDDALSSGVDIGGGRVGPGEKIQLTIYGGEDDRARLEIAVDDMTPVAGSSHEFALRAPEMRLRTKDGHAVRVTARRGLLEAQRRRDRGLDPRRGTLTGDVLIQYDRLSESERAGLPEAQRGQLDPADLVEITMDEIEFDLEYSKLVVPGSVRLFAVDFELDAGDLEIRFNDAENRVEYMRIGRAGRLALREQSGQLGLSIPTVGTSDRSRFSLTEWFNTAVQAAIVRKQEQATQDTPPAPRTQLALTDDGVPVFRPDAEDELTTEPPTRYHVHFEGDVDARQLAGDVTRARLEADILEILRDFSQEDRARVQSGAAPEPESDDDRTLSSGERLVVTWTERLVIEACRPEDDRCRDEGGSRVSAAGAPVRISRVEGDATCRRFTFRPETAKASLYGMPTEPAVVNDPDQGTLTGVEIHSERSAGAFSLRVAGPGKLVQDRERTSTRAEPTQTVQDRTTTVEFTESFEASGRFLTRPVIDLAGRVLLQRQRVVDNARFAGDVTARQGETAVSADVLNAMFTPPRGFFSRSARQHIDRVVGEGHVNLGRGADRVLCHKIDIEMTGARHGETVPSTATATGDVVAEQADGVTLQARDKLIVDFGPVDDAGDLALDTGAEVARTAATEARGESEGLASDANAHASEPGAEEARRERRSGAVVKRLRAFGEVTVTDPNQGLDVSAETLDSTLVGGRDIETALVEGLEDRPATVRLGTFTVIGRTVDVNVPEQRAEVPGAGRLTFRSRKDLDGRRALEPIPIAVTWSDWMNYVGPENRAVFSGDVHATSETTTTFDCDHLMVEFEDVPTDIEQGEPGPRPWIFKKLAEQFRPTSADEGDRAWRSRFAKEPAYLLATGNAVALTSEIDPVTNAVRSRSRISGPQLSVNLRPDVSKMVIEGPGNLLLEDNRSAVPRKEADTVASPRGLFSADDSSGPSNTLIEWDELMWYDFSIDQTRFEGRVSLKHFSGAELMRVRGRSVDESTETAPGRATFLTCDTLTVDFVGGDESPRGLESRRMGRLSANRLRQFQATGSVVLQDQTEGLSLTAERVLYWKDRDLLGIYGTSQRFAHIVTQRPGRLPNQLQVERMFYELGSGDWQLTKATLRTR